MPIVVVDSKTFSCCLSSSLLSFYPSLPLLFLPFREKKWTEWKGKSPLPQSCVLLLLMGSVGCWSGLWSELLDNGSKLQGLRLWVSKDISCNPPSIYYLFVNAQNWDNASWNLKHHSLSICCWLESFILNYFHFTSSLIFHSYFSKFMTGCLTKTSFDNIPSMQKSMRDFQFP